MGSTTLSTNTSRCSAQFLLFLPCQLWLKVRDFHVILATELQSLHIVLLNQLMGLQNLLTLLQNQLDTLHLLTPLQQNPLISQLLPFQFSFLSASSSSSQPMNLTTVRRSFQDNGPMDIMKKVQDVYQAVLE